MKKNNNRYFILLTVKILINFYKMSFCDIYDLIRIHFDISLIITAWQTHHLTEWALNMKENLLVLTLFSRKLFNIYHNVIHIRVLYLCVTVLNYILNIILFRYLYGLWLNNIFIHLSFKTFDVFENIIN